MKRPPFSALGAVGVVAGCAGMASMLPGAAIGVLGAIGISGSSGLARTLSPAAEPLFLASAVFVVLGALTCSRLVALFAISGSVLLYLSMFELASGGAKGGGSMSMTSMQPHQHSALRAEPTSFYLGLALLVSAYSLSFYRRRHRQCRPVFRLRLKTVP